MIDERIPKPLLFGFAAAVLPLLPFCVAIAAAVATDRSTTVVAVVADPELNHEPLIDRCFAAAAPAASINPAAVSLLLQSDSTDQNPQFHCCFGGVVVVAVVRSTKSTESVPLRSVEIF